MSLVDISERFLAWAQSLYGVMIPAGLEADMREAIAEEKLRDDQANRIDKLERRLEAYIAQDNRIDAGRLAAYDAHVATEGQQLAAAERRLAQLEQSGAIEKLEDDMATLRQLLEGETDG